MLEGGCVRSNYECRCSCHRLPVGTVKHVMACCSPCPECHKNIKPGYLEYHIQADHGKKQEEKTVCLCKPGTCVGWDHGNKFCRQQSDKERGFCRQCGATIPHRVGEGRCEWCMWAMESGTGEPKKEGLFCPKCGSRGTYKEDQVITHFSKIGWEDGLGSPGQMAHYATQYTCICGYVWRLA